MNVHAPPKMNLALLYFWAVYMTSWVAGMLWLVSTALEALQRP